MNVSFNNPVNNRYNQNSFALKVENISKIFDSAGGQVIALRKINFVIKRGSLYQLWGHQVAANLHY